MSNGTGRRRDARPEVLAISPPVAAMGRSPRTFTGSLFGSVAWGGNLLGEGRDCAVAALA